MSDLNGRVEAAAKALGVLFGCRSEAERADRYADAQYTLETADRFDAAHGIVRVRVDDALTERIADVLEALDGSDYFAVAAAVAALTGRRREAMSRIDEIRADLALLARREGYMPDAAARIVASFESIQAEVDRLTADLARETELRRKAERHVALLQQSLDAAPYPGDVEDATARAVRAEQAIQRVEKCVQNMQDAATLARVVVQGADEQSFVCDAINEACNNVRAALAGEDSTDEK